MNKTIDDKILHEGHVITNIDEWEDLGKYADYEIRKYEGHTYIVKLIPESISHSVHREVYCVCKPVQYNDRKIALDTTVTK